MKTIFKIILGIIGAFVIMGMLFAGCTAFVFNEADKEITKSEDKAKKDSKEVNEVGTTKTFEGVEITVNSIEEVNPPEYTEHEGTFYKVSYTVNNTSDEDAMFSSTDFKMQSEGKQFEEEFGYNDGFDIDTVNAGNEVTGNSYFVDTKGTTEQPIVQGKFSPFMFDTHKANWK